MAKNDALIWELVDQLNPNAAVFSKHDHLWVTEVALWSIPDGDTTTMLLHPQWEDTVALEDVFCARCGMKGSDFV